MENPPNTDDWVLPFLFLGMRESDKLAVKGSLMLFKQFFVFVKEIKPDLDKKYNFIPYDYGPYSFILKNLLNDLELSGFIQIVRYDDRTDYYLTESGVDKAKELSEKIDQKTKELILKLREEAENLGYAGVLRYVYSKYPEYTFASKIRDQVNGY